MTTESCPSVGQRQTGGRTHSESNVKSAKDKCVYFLKRLITKTADPSPGISTKKKKIKSAENGFFFSIYVTFLLAKFTLQLSLGEMWSCLLFSWSVNLPLDGGIYTLICNTETNRSQSDEFWGKA